VQEFAGGSAGGEGEVDGAGQSDADAAPGGMKCLGEADPVGVEIVVVGCGVGEGAQGVVHAQIAPGFLVDPGGGA